MGLLLPLLLYYHYKTNKFKQLHIMNKSVKVYSLLSKFYYKIMLTLFWNDLDNFIKRWFFLGLWCCNVCISMPPENIRKPAVGISLFKVNHRNTRKRCEICSKLTIKTPERCHWRRTSVFIANFEHMSHPFLVFLTSF